MFFQKYIPCWVQISSFIPCFLNLLLRLVTVNHRFKVRVPKCSLWMPQSGQIQKRLAVVSIFRDPVQLSLAGTWSWGFCMFFSHWYVGLSSRLSPLDARNSWSRCFFTLLAAPKSEIYDIMIYIYIYLCSSENGVPLHPLAYHHFPHENAYLKGTPHFPDRPTSDIMLITCVACWNEHGTDL